MNDELLDIVNEHDEVIGQQYRSEFYKNRITSFRVINAFLVNDQGQLWIPRRTATKKLFPSCLDTSVGGHVAAGESYQQAFERELQEELNLNAASVSYKMVGKLTPLVHNVSAHMHLYLIYTNTTPDYNTDDFTEAHWHDVPELLDTLNNGERAKSDLSILIKFLQTLL